MALRNLEEQVLYLTQELEKVKQSLGNALPDPIPGPQGVQGEQGEQGEQGVQGYGIIGNGTQLPSYASNGNYFILRTSGIDGIDLVLYKCINNHWVAQYSLRGNQGPVGDGADVVANPDTAYSESLYKITVDGVTYSVSTVEKYNGADNPYTFIGLEAVTINGNNYFVGGTWAKYLSSVLYFDDDNNEVVCEEDAKFKKDIYLTNNKTIYGGAGTSNEVEISGNYYLSGNVSLDDIQQFIDEDGNPIIVCENLKDENHKKRFVEGNINTETITGVTFTYHKWSLSCSHLMLVLAGNIASGTSLGVQILGGVDLPDYINQKIHPLFASTVIATNDARGYYDDWNSINMQTTLMKTSTGVYFYLVQNPTATQDAHFRIQFDLLIDMA